MNTPKRDYSATPFKRLVVMGESTVQGGAWLGQIEDRFADVLANLINTCQNIPVEYHNKGIGANAISPRSPGYEQSAKPSALERYKTDVIDLNPDLFILCYGLNDMRADMPIGDFTEDMQTIIGDVKTTCNPLIVLTTVYHMTGFGSFAPYDKGSINKTRLYNEAIRRLAENNDCLLADVWAGQGLADWLIHPDGVHANKVGNLIIAHRIFETIGQHCSGITVDVHKQDAKSEWTKNATQKRKSAGDPFDPWWMPVPSSPELSKM